MSKKLIKKRDLIFFKFGGKCAYCGEPIHNMRITKKGIERMELEHVVPKERFKKCILEGTLPWFLKHLKENDVNHHTNLFPSCRTCNRYKSTLLLEDFRKELSLQVERAKNDSFNFKMALRYNQIVIKPKPIVFYFENFGDYKQKLNF